MQATEGTAAVATPQAAHARELEELAEFTAGQLTRTASGREALSTARSELPPLPRSDDSSMAARAGTFPLHSGFAPV